MNNKITLGFLCLFVVLALSIPPEASAELVSHWKMDGDATDSAGDNDGIPFMERHSGEKRRVKDSAGEGMD